MSALFYIAKAICWLLIGLIVDFSLDSFSIIERLPTFIAVCAAIFVFEMLMDRTGGNQKLAAFVQER